MPGPVPAATRAAIEAELLEPRDPPRSRAAIGRDHGVSGRTVTRFADALGILPDEPWKTDVIAAATKSATDRRRADRSVIADELQAKARELLENMSGPFLVFAFGGRDNTYEEHILDGPPTGDIKNLMTSVSLALKGAMEIDKQDVSDGDDQARATLDKLFGGLGAVYQHIRRDRGDDADEPQEATP